MAIPNFQMLMLPVLRASADGEVKISDVVGTVDSLCMSLCINYFSDFVLY
jgi:hypothetical protein